MSTPTETVPASTMARVPDLVRGDLVVTETGVYQILGTKRYLGRNGPAGIPCWHIEVATIAGELRGGLVRTDWDYLPRFKMQSDLGARVARVEALHYRKSWIVGADWCNDCLEDWPCATIRALAAVPSEATS